MVRLKIATPERANATHCVYCTACIGLVLVDILCTVCRPTAKLTYRRLTVLVSDGNKTKMLRPRPRSRPKV